MNTTRNLLGLLAVCAVALLGTVGCSTSGTTTTSTSSTSSTSSTLSSIGTTLENFVWTAANMYEKANTGGVLTQSIASSILSATKSDPSTTAEVLAATALADKVAAAGVAAHDAGATPQGVTNAQTALLADPGVISSTAAAAQAQASIIDARNRLLVANGFAPSKITQTDIDVVVGKIRTTWQPKLVAAR